MTEENDPTKMKKKDDDNDGEDDDDGVGSSQFENCPPPGFHTHSPVSLSSREYNETTQTKQLKHTHAYTHTHQEPSSTKLSSTHEDTEQWISLASLVRSCPPWLVCYRTAPSAARIS